MLKFPGEEVVTRELFHRPANQPVDIGTGFSHLVVQADNLAVTIEALSRSEARGVAVVTDGLSKGRPQPPACMGSKTLGAQGSLGAPRGRLMRPGDHGIWPAPLSAGHR